MKFLIFCVCIFCVLMPYSAEEDRVVEQRVLADQPDRGYLGFVPRYDQAEDGRGGIRVLEIVPDSPAGRSGLAKDDLIIDFNGVPFLFGNNLEMMRSLGSVRAGTRLELTLLRGSEVHTEVLLPTVMPPDQTRALAEWIKRAEAAYEASCIRERAVKHAFRAFKQSIPAPGARLAIIKDPVSHEIQINSPSITIPPDLDLSQIPLLSGLFRDLRPGDSLDLLCVLGESRDELRIRPLAVPAYLQSHLAGVPTPTGASRPDGRR